MRVTNTMLSNSAKSHILNAKNKKLKYEEQYASQQKIQRPSDDPVVAVRSLKLRTTYAQIEQYTERNVKDAMEWMDMTEGAMTIAGKVLDSMKGLLDQGNCDDLEVDERNSVVQTLRKNVETIFQGEANQDYSGRYLFTGYRTDTSLLFPSVTTNLEYKITENFSYDSFRNVTSVIGGATYSEDITDGQEYIDNQAYTSTSYRLQLAYKDCAILEGFGGNFDPLEENPLLLLLLTVMVKLLIYLHQHQSFQPSLILCVTLKMMKLFISMIQVRYLLAKMFFLLYKRHRHHSLFNILKKTLTSLIYVQRCILQQSLMTQLPIKI